MGKRIMKVGILLVAILGIVYIAYTAYIFTGPVHRPISTEDIKEVEFWGKDRIVKKPTDDDVIHLVEWFNSTSDIRLNKDFAGTTPESGVQIRLKSGKHISILNSGSNFEIQRYDVRLNIISYWGKQTDIEKLLSNLYKGTN